MTNSNPQTLTVTTSGICTHFIHTVPGIPHRAVFPDATAIRFGVLELPDGTAAAYSLMPHVVLLGVNGTSRQLLGARVEVTNAVTPQKLEVCKGGFRIKQYVDNFAFSEDVVTGGNAACYFDVFGGIVEPLGTPTTQNTTRITITTYGTPHVRITPFPDSVTSDEELDVPGGEMTLANLDFDDAAEDKDFDFLLNYLVARGGIPRKLKQRVPGLESPPPPLTTEMVSKQLSKLAAKIAALPASPATGRMPPEHLEKLRSRVGATIGSPSCSDSIYP